MPSTCFLTSIDFIFEGCRFVAFVYHGFSAAFFLFVFDWDLFVCVFILIVFLFHILYILIDCGVLF